ncbi:immune inhibitor A [Shewanella eurypsychrophilus]|uniref:Immune inhibitor A n=1 Tax=Shewanella eurypsychrophilus TaxID=2593656 RepID=A0ABX6VDW9_9GAMM|nr:MULTISPECIES: immune inhibitor A domain-containing protein [Shewanella]QFU25005.1 M6 family metalloprotease domain-containing protein [Shewanella sp. YLB-09]QPG60181.1 immune inhibitor A [Shewanella eurypsychrophilus]
MKSVKSIGAGSLASLSLSLILGISASSSALAKPIDITPVNLSALDSGTLADAGVINKERILYWLIKRGEVSPSASDAEKQAAVEQFTHRATSFQSKGRLVEAQFEKSRIKSLIQSKQLKRNSIAKMDNMVGTLADADITKTVKVLGILIDFPDLPFDDNRLSASDTAMFYPNYPVTHYNDLMFSTTGFTGPQGQSLMTGYQYYQAESGQRFEFTGDVKGWFTAANNAAFYGGNDADNNDDDKAVPELVKEAVIKAVAGMSESELASYDVEDPFDLDGDGNFDEADGDIDHVMLFHSSIGEEAGGGVLADDAIWSHRFFVYTGNTPGYSIPGKNIRVFGYTVQPIDAAAGVVVHEFGHDLGLPDEYDTTNTGDGSPVGSWSVMSGGSWTGAIAGTVPTGFSPYARSYLQDRYKGRWINEQEVLLSSIGSSGLDVVINEAVNHSLVNQLSIPLPAATIPFKQPYGGSYQYYSGQGHLINNALSFDIDLPSSTPLTLTMKAHWNIELDYDYAQLMVDGVVIAGNHTKASNTINTARDIITGDSGDIVGAEGLNNWVDLEYDLTAYAGRANTQISIIYKTDQAAGDYGFVFDNLQISNGTTVIHSDDAETVNTMVLNGFSRIDDERPGASRRYIVQLRSHNGVDAGLDSHSYEPGVLMWLENFSNTDNNSSTHPGTGLIGVIDADQNLIGSNSTSTQVRDASFSMFNQSSYFEDNHLSSVSMFDDSQDYSAPTQPQSGIILPELGLTMEVLAQSSDSSTATVRFNFAGTTTPPPASDLTSSFSFSQEVIGTVSFVATVSGGNGNYSYLWNFGDNGATSAEEAPTYTYQDSGSYLVTLTVTDGQGASVESTQAVTVDLPVAPIAGFTFVTSDLDVTFTDTTTGGEGAMTYLWNFGDGQSSTAQSPTHTYAAAGSYTVIMTVTDSLGIESNRSTSITVTAAVVTPPVVTPSSGGSGGGSLGWLSLSLLALLGFRRSNR